MNYAIGTPKTGRPPRRTSVISRQAISAALVLSAAAVLVGACEATPPELHVETGSAKLTGGPTPATFADLIGIASQTNGSFSNGANQTDLLDKITALGVHRLRIDFTWQSIQPTSDPNTNHWNWAAYDTFVSLAQSRNVQILGILDYGAAWANTTVYGPGGDSQAPPDRLQNFNAFAVAVAQRYIATVHAYEIWNEPNNGGNFWHPARNTGCTPRTGVCTGVDFAPRSTQTGVYGDPGLYAHLTAAAIKAIRSANFGGQAPPLVAPGGTIFLQEPFAVVVGNDSGTKFMGAAFAAEPTLPVLSDAVTLHAYDAYPPNEAPEAANASIWGTTNVPIDQKIAQMNAAFSAPAGTPVWLTEIGWPTRNCVTEQRQGNFLIRSAVLSALNGVDQIYFYNMYDAEANGGICTFDLAPEHFFGLIRYGGYPKASYTAIQRFVALLGGYHVTGSEVAAGARAWQKPYIVDVADASGHRGKIVWDAIEPSLNPQYTIAIPPGWTCDSADGGACTILANGQLALGVTPFYLLEGAPPPPSEKLVGCNRAGDVMDSQGGVVAYCDDARESGEFQCDQYANRFMSSRGLPPVDNWVNNLACEICDLVTKDANLGQYYEAYGPGYQPPAGHSPVPGDLLVFTETSGCNEMNKGSPGHVAVVTDAQSDYIAYIQQNWMVGASVSGSAYAGLVRASTSWSPSTSFFGTAGGNAAYLPKCWVHPRTPNPGPVPNPCSGVTHTNNGLYCGRSPQTGFYKQAADPNTVYECFDGQIADEFRCAAGCYIASQGYPDGCNSDDPCSGIGTSGDGVYCGASKQFGFNQSGTANHGWLYTCSGGVEVAVATSNCGDSGCTVNPIGADSCTAHASSDPCAGVSVDGTYCGASPAPGFNAKIANSLFLYTCRGGRTLKTALCGAGGCTYNPSGPDSCNGATDPCHSVPSSENGTYCWNSPQNGFQSKYTLQDWLYVCKDGHTVDNDQCEFGCRFNASGPDRCN